MNFYAPSWDTCKAMECFFSYGGEFFLSQSARSSLSIFAHVSSPQKASGIQSSQSITAKGGYKVL